MFNGPKYTLKRGWGGKFATETRKFEFYSETMKKGLLEHAKKFNTSVDDILSVSGYVARGEVAFVPHYEPPKRHGSAADYPFDFVDYKSRLNREGRSANLPWYQEFKKVDPGDVSWGDVLKMNPLDGARLGLKTGDTVRITSMAGSMVSDLKLWEGIRPGTVTKCFGQGHWAYGRVASKDFAKGVANGGNNNDILVDGLQPACVEVCPSQARIFGDQEDPKAPIAMILAKEKSFRLLEEKGTKPNVHYIGKYSVRA